LAVSLATPLGAILGRAGAVSLGPALTGALLGFAGGSFLYVGLAQIIPHLWRKRDFGCAVAAAAGCGFFLLLNSLSF
jgi:zinc transporter ZupT